MRSIYSYFLFILMLTFLNANAQNNYNVWVFGRNAGLDFNYNPPRAITIKPFYSIESSSSICDRNGVLLFYTNGDTIFNRLNQPMLNGMPTILNQQRQSSIQGSLILPVPGKANQYYVFLSPSTASTDSFLRYWIIDMSRNSGLGEVIQKETSLFAGGVEAFSVTQHANKLDYWVASMDPKGNYFRSIRSVNGLFTTLPQTQKIDHFSTQRVMNNKFSPDSRVFTGQLNSKLVNNEWFNYFDLFQFDNTSGQLSNRILIPGFVPSTASIYFEFSPNSRFLYAFETDNRSSPVIRRVVQYDLSVWDSTAICNSRTVIYRSTINLSYELIRGMQLGPDGKIYIFATSDNSLSVIDSPNNQGLACNFRHRAFPLASGSNCEYGGPYYPSFKLITPIVHIGKDTSICIGDSIELHSGSNFGDQVRWSNGDTTASIYVKSSGNYFVTVNGTNSNTIKVTVAKKFRVYLGPDTAFCNSFLHILNAGKGARSYNWNTGETTEKIGVTQAGKYIVKVNDSFNCLSGDTIQIDKLIAPKVTLEFDSINCQFVIIGTSKIDGIRYLWNTGDTTTQIKVYQKGIYVLKAQNAFCEVFSRINLDFLAKPELNLGADRTLCETPIILKSLDPGEHLWSTGDTIKILNIVHAGKYWVHVNRNGCSAMDTIIITECPDINYFIPDVFTPNGDFLNDVFKISGTNISDIQIEVFNRWGEKICFSEGLEANWDGTYQNKVCPDGVYFYRLIVKGMLNGSTRTFIHKGTLTLMR